ncbi:MAG: N-6 DNA methylase [Planctomycetota bacterium]|nr:N-6 DNA methylase [Planctomycetota bacterium]
MARRSPGARTGAWAYFRSADEVKREPALLGYAHHILRAFEPNVLGITGVMCVDDRPTVYFRRYEKPLSWVDANRLHRIFWNQGIATVLILADPDRLRIYSGQAQPVKEGDATEQPKALIEAPLKNIADLLELEDLLHDIASGQFYTRHPDHFDQKQAVDECLLRNLGAARDKLVSATGGMREEAAHALLGRLIFLCYLTDRKIINWSDYEDDVGDNVRSIRELLEAYNSSEGLDRLYRLFRRLGRAFNGSMFDQTLGTERRKIRTSGYTALRLFFSVGDVTTGQQSLPFWAYDFGVIPVETISAIYEDFLTKEDAEGKHKQGAYYTPRHLAEMAVDVAIAGDTGWHARRYLDPACGSGVFLVTLFNRLASRWEYDHPLATYKQRADALLGILHRQLCGIDIQRTACRIACFSLYLAFLDHFEPRDLYRDFQRRARRKHDKILPKLMHYTGSTWRETHSPTVVQGDFLRRDTVTQQFDVIIGNPPWSDRGTKQKAWEFMQHASLHLRDGGHGCLLLPAKVFFNKTDQLQREWLSAVTLERVINLSDFRFILFEHAKCPALIVRFLNAAPDAEHRFDYETPKVSGADCRDGVVTIFPHDRKRLRQDAVLAAADRKEAPKLWKRYLSGSPRDLRLLDLLDDMPRLGRLACTAYRAPARRTRWLKGQGVQPDTKLKCKEPQYPWWKKDRLFLDARTDCIQMFVFPDDCKPVGNRLPRLYFARHPDLFEPPLVVASQGFGKVAFCDFPVLFQHSLQSITVASSEPAKRAADADLLLFLTAYLRSSLARYYLFHTAANWGTERDKVHLFELLQLPFPIPGDHSAHPEAKAIVAKVASAAKALQKTLAQDSRRLHDLRASTEWDPAADTEEAFAARRQRQIAELQAELEPEVYRYFDLTDEEIALVEDTNNIFEPSSTPPNRKAAVPSLAFVGEKALATYAETLTATLNEWAKGGVSRVQASAVRFSEKPFVLLTLQQVNDPRPFRFAHADAKAQALLARIYDAARQSQGRLEYPRAVTFFDGSRVHLLKPATLVQWTRTAALNDADEIFAEVVRQRRGRSP